MSAKIFVWKYGVNLLVVKKEVPAFCYLVMTSTVTHVSCGVTTRLLRQIYIYLTWLSVLSCDAWTVNEVSVISCDLSHIVLIWSCWSLWCRVQTSHHLHTSSITFTLAPVSLWDLSPISVPESQQSRSIAWCHKYVHNICKVRTHLLPEPLLLTR